MFYNDPQQSLLFVFVICIFVYLFVMKRKTKEVNNKVGCTEGD